MSSISFDNPYLLFLAIPIAALFVIPYAIAIRKDNLNGHNIASGIIHILMAVIIAFVAAGTSIVTTVTETDVYVVADVSYSANRNLDKIDDYIEDLGKSLPRNSRLGVVTFGKDYQLLTRLGEKTKSVRNSIVDDSATDIVSALAYTGSLFREDVIKRIVLITDGKQTGETDSNALKRQVDALAESKIHVDAIYLDDNIDRDAREVQLSSVQVKPTTFLRREAYAKLTVNCSCSGEVNALLKVKRIKQGSDEAEPTELASYSVVFSQGNNSYSLPLYTEEEGVYDYEVEISCENSADDANTHNNKLTFTQEVSGKLSVLVILGDDPADEQIIADAYGDSAQITARYYGSDDIKTTVEWINQYDEIVLSNVDVTKMNNYRTFLKSLDTAVSMFGKSLVTFGDTNIQNTKGELKELSGMLPVIYGKADSEEKLYTLVIDTSRSMESMGRLARAKEAAIEIVNNLDDADTVSVVQFNGSPDDVEPKLIKVGDGKERIIKEINSLTVRQGTNIPAALQFALPTATSGNYGERRLFLFSDGMNYSLDAATTTVESVVTLMRDRGVVTSVLDVGRAGYGTSDARRGLNMLKNVIAVRGGGTYMDISTDENYQDVIHNQLPEDINSSDGGASAIYVKRRAEDMLQNVDLDELQSNATYVDKFIYARAKGAATTVLQVEYVGISDKTTEVPLYAYWNYGSGSVASFTTGLSNQWIPEVSLSLRSQLIRGILETNVPDEKISEPFTLDIEATDGYAEVTLAPESYNPASPTSIEIISPDGKTSARTALSGNGSEFKYTFVTRDEGKYTVRITYKDHADIPGREPVKEYTVERAVHVAYSSEYDSFVLYDAAALHKMIGSNGTVSENGKLTLVNDEREVGLYNVSLNLPLLISCVVLYAVDIAVRKLKWEDIKSLFKRHKKVK